MEQLGQVVSRAVAQSSESTTQPKASSATIRASKVWRAMAELYGGGFVAAYGEQPTPLWLAAIAELSDKECRDGLTRLAKQAREYPANLTQFVGACRPSPGVRYLGAPLTPQQYAELAPPPEKRASAEKIDGWLAKMRRTLGVGG